MLTAVSTWTPGARRAIGTAVVIRGVSGSISTVGAEPDANSGFWELYESTLPKIYAYLLHRSNRDVAEDLTQEVYLTAARAVADRPGAEIGEAWLFTVARSRLFDHFRSQGRADRNRAAIAVLREPAVSATEDDHAATHLDCDTLTALEALSSAQRAALVLHHVDDLSVAEVADRLGRSVRATESLLARARREFRSALEEAGHG